MNDVDDDRDELSKKGQAVCQLMHFFGGQLSLVYGINRLQRKMKNEIICYYLGMECTNGFDKSHGSGVIK